MALWRKLRTLSAADRRLLAEAGRLLVLTRIGLWLLPYPKLRRVLDRAHPSGWEPPREFPNRVSWAVTAVARRLPGMTCGKMDRMLLVPATDIFSSICSAVGRAPA